MRELLAKPYLYYRNEIFPRVKHIRGTSWLKRRLISLANLSTPKVNEVSEPLSGLKWDNLLILDGCRQDIYEQLTGEESYRISAGATSKEFIKENFSSGTWSDVVYVTANPFFFKPKFEELTGRDPEEVFHEVFYTFETDWDEEENTVLPESVGRDARTAEKLFPDKRKIIHFMQPHTPFVKSDLEWGGFDHIFKDTDLSKNVWGATIAGDVSHEEAIEAYRQNLVYVLDEVDSLKDSLEGDTFVTADHGNYIGEAGMYGHPEGHDSPSLNKVPFHKIK